MERYPELASIVSTSTLTVSLKTVDTNSAYFAKYCFSLGINVKRIEVIADDEGEIAEAARRMSEKYDFVVTRQAIKFLNQAQLAKSYCPQRWNRPDVSTPSTIPLVQHHILK